MTKKPVAKTPKDEFHERLSGPITDFVSPDDPVFAKIAAEIIAERGKKKVEPKKEPPKRRKLKTGD
jgi:hypothetical protein